MASSPPYNYGNAVSPPNPPHITIPNSSKRRSTEMMPTSAPAVKRRKHSMLSNVSGNQPLHSSSLRHASFPPQQPEEEARYSPSPSVDNLSMVSSNTKGGTQSKKSLGKRRANDDDTSSLVSGQGRGMLAVRNSRAGGVRGSKELSRGPSAGADAEDDDDDGDDGGAMALTVDTSRDNSSRAIQARNYIIREAMDPRQQERFDAWHASKLNTAMVKKLINQTLSQSVPEAVVFAIRVAAKLFAGEIIERSRKVREQWISVSLETQLGRPKPMLGLPSPPAEAESTESSQFATQVLQSSTSSSATMSQRETDAEREARLDRENRGPLLPEHVQEAFRRYKEFDGPDREMLNISRMQRSSGAERFGVKNRKGRLFGGCGAVG